MGLTFSMLAALLSERCADPDRVGLRRHSNNEIVITPSSGCGLLDGLYGWNWSTGVVEPSTVLRDRSAHAGVQPREHTSACGGLA